MKRRISLSVLIATVIMVCFAVTQLQPALVQGFGAVNGTFGLRPMSHDCAGLRISGDKLAWLPDGDGQGRLWLFAFRYSVPADPSGQTFCLGQDLWYGE
jgi:hypothetical protein